MKALYLVDCIPCIGDFGCCWLFGDEDDLALDARLGLVGYFGHVAEDEEEESLCSAAPLARTAVAVAEETAELDHA